MLSGKEGAIPTTSERTQTLSCSPLKVRQFCVLLLQFVTSAVVLAVVLPRSSRSVKWLVSAGLAQVSEFSFVLSSRARRLGLISREVSSTDSCVRFAQCQPWIHLIHRCKKPCPKNHLICDKQVQTGRNNFQNWSDYRGCWLLLLQVYLLILSVTTLSLLIAPLVWKGTLWHFRVRRKRYPLFCLQIRAIGMDYWVNRVAWQQPW